MPPLTGWFSRALVAVTAIVSTASGAADAIVAAVIDAAEVDAPAERGASVTLGTPRRPSDTPYGLPVTERATWAATHAGYPATDIFDRCGAPLVSPVYGTVLEVRRVDLYDPAVDDPATRGGKYVSILGFDGVRYYLAHLDTVAVGIAPGVEVALGQSLGTMGDTGRSSACHLHFSISPPCPEREWSVRRGAIWPYPYLDAWRAGEQRSPAPEITRWVAEHPDACDAAAADPFAPGA